MNNAQAQARLDELAVAMLNLIVQIIADPNVDMDEEHGFYNLLVRAKSAMTIIHEEKIIREYKPVVSIKLNLKRMVIDFEEIKRISNGILPEAASQIILRDLRFLSEVADKLNDDFKPIPTTKAEI